MANCHIVLMKKGEERHLEHSVGRWSSGGEEFRTIRSRRVTRKEGGEERRRVGVRGRGHAITAFHSLRLQATGGSKGILRKWIRLSPFPLSHQPGKEIQRGNLKKEKGREKKKKEQKEKQMEVSPNRHPEGERN